MKLNCEITKDLFKILINDYIDEFALILFVYDYQLICYPYQIKEST